MTLTGNHFIYSLRIPCRFVPHPAKLLSRGCSKVPKRSSVAPPPIKTGQVYLEVSLNGHEFTERMIFFIFVEDMQVVEIDPAFGDLLEER
jgi:hypothetical protein